MSSELNNECTGDQRCRHDCGAEVATAIVSERKRCADKMKKRANELQAIRGPRADCAAYELLQMADAILKGDS